MKHEIILRMLYACPQCGRFLENQSSGFRLHLTLPLLQNECNLISDTEVIWSNRKVHVLINVSSKAYLHK